MRICYVLLSPTFGMHQYTADLANRMAQAGHAVHLVTTAHLARDRYAPTVTIHTPVHTTNTGFSPESLHPGDLQAVHQTIVRLVRQGEENASPGRPDIVHFTGPHLWNVPLVQGLVKEGIPVVHTLHDLEPHAGVHYNILIRLWNQLIISSAHQVVVHGQTYREQLLNRGVSPQKVTYTPLLHLFLSSARQSSLASELASCVQYQRWALFFGRLERYKGVDHLLAACAMMKTTEAGSPKVVLAGPGSLAALWSGPLPQGAELRNRLIPDEEAIDLFRRCGLVVLPYIDATQSALVAAAYYFRKPVVVTRAGALPEYVEDGHTGRVMEPDHPASLARCLEELLSDPARLAQMGSAGRAWYDANRAYEMRIWLDIYQRLVETLPVGRFVTALAPDRVK